ncbi:MAG: SDR family NAD(P)-dependent oxidoreductase [Eubacteriales bacterium]|nr:SDR family NAD(P)-dependent oxidoreductase [Eubacteriales bacterium]
MKINDNGQCRSHEAGMTICTNQAGNGAAGSGGDSKTAIVTGGTRGMGADISLILAGSGYNVLAVYRSNEESAAATLKKIKSISPESEIMRADVSKKTEATRVAEYAASRYGSIYALVNNAGIFDFSFLEEMSEAFFDRIFNTNFKGQLFMTQAVIPYMKKTGAGRIINATSISGTLADVGLVAYAASKASSNLMTKTAAGELAPYGITVNSYAPGIIHTDMTDAMIKERGHLQLKQIPAGYFGKGIEVASLVKFLCSAEAGYITGEIIGVDGGMMKVQNPYRAYEYVNKSMI